MAFWAWAARFFEDEKDKPSSHRLDMIASHWAALAVLLLLAGVAAGIAIARSAAPGMLLPVLTLLLDNVRWIIYATLTGATTNHLYNQTLKNRATAKAGAVQAAGDPAADPTPKPE